MKPWKLQITISRWENGNLVGYAYEKKSFWFEWGARRYAAQYQPLEGWRIDSRILTYPNGHTTSL